MAQKHTGFVWLIALAGGGFIAWQIWGQKLGADNGVTPTPAIDPGQLPTATSQTSNIVSQQAASVMGPVDVNGTPLPVGITQDMYNTVFTWAYGDGRAPVKAMANALIPSEYQGMYNIITTQWQTGARATSAQVKIWDDLRNKYDPSHQQW